MEQSLVPFDKPQYRYWQAYFLAFFSSKLYVDVAKRWHGGAMLYLLSLSFIMAIPLTIQFSVYFGRYLQHQIIEPIRLLPAIEIQQGRVRTNQSTPILIRNSSYEVVAIIDDRSEVNLIKNLSKNSTKQRTLFHYYLEYYPKLSILINANQMYYRLPAFGFFLNSAKSTKDTVYIQTLSPKTNQIFKGEDWIKTSAISWFKDVSFVVVYPALAFIFFTSYLSLFLVLALLGQFVAIYLIKQPVSYLEALRLLNVSATPYLLTAMIAIATGIQLPGKGFLLLTILEFYFAFAIISIKRARKDLLR